MFVIEFYRSILIPGVITVSWQKCVCFVLVPVQFDSKLKRLPSTVKTIYSGLVISCKVIQLAYFQKAMYRL